jgi:hypothetical protein
MKISYEFQDFVQGRSGELVQPGKVGRHVRWRYHGGIHKNSEVDVNPDCGLAYLY